MKIIENHWKSLENQWKSLQIIENHSKPLGINWIFKKILEPLEHYYSSNNPISARNSAKSLLSPPPTMKPVNKRLNQLETRDEPTWDSGQPTWDPGWVNLRLGENQVGTRTRPKRKQTPQPTWDPGWANLRLGENQLETRPRPKRKQTPQPTWDSARPKRLSKKMVLTREKRQGPPPLKP